MEILIDRRYPVGASAARAWMLLTDMPFIATCMPGAELTDQVDENNFKGKVKVKVGPAIASFNGSVELLQVDQELQQIEMSGKGADRSGSQASLNLTALIEPIDNVAESILVGHATINVKGKFAQYGERMLVNIADMILDQFIENFSAAASTMSSGAGTQEDTQPPSMSTIRDAVSGQSNELNAIALLWRLLKARVARIFGKGN